MKMEKNVLSIKMKLKEAVIFVEKLNKLNQEHAIITKEEFNTGKVAFAPMSFAQYRTYKLYPLRVKKFSDFEWIVECC